MAPHSAASVNSGLTWIILGLLAALAAVLAYSRGRAWPISFVAFVLSGPVLAVVVIVGEAIRGIVKQTSRSSALAAALQETGASAFVASGLAAAIVAAAVYAYSMRRELRAERAFRRLPPPGPPRPKPSAALQALGLEPHATLDDLEHVYREQAFRLHPDRGGDVQEFKLLQANYERAKRVIALRMPVGRVADQASQERPSSQ